MKVLYLAFFILLASSCSSNVTKNDAMIPLFNGKDLNGWTSDAESDYDYWTVLDGILRVRSGPEEKGSHLWTDKVYTDYKLSLEYKLIGGRIDSGVMVRDGGDQIQIGESGSLKRDLTAAPYIPGGIGYPVEATEALKTIKSDGWNELIVQVQGNVYKTWLNGVEGITYKSESAKESGKIGLQLHGKRDMQIDFRNIRVMEL